MEITSIIIRPRLTEKTQAAKMRDNPKMSFVVNPKSNKRQIAYAFYSLFGIKALSVNTSIKKPQPTRATKFGKKNYSKAMKVAYISVSKENIQKLQDEAIKRVEQMKSNEGSKPESENVLPEAEGAVEGVVQTEGSEGNESVEEGNKKEE